MTYLLGAVWLLGATAGCGNGRARVPDAGVRGPEGGVLTFDAAMILPHGDAGGVRDGGPPRDVGPSDAGSNAADRRLFVPDIPHVYAGTLIDPGIEILAFTIWQDPVLHQSYFLVSVRNVSSSLRLCSLDMTTHFLDAAGAEIGLSQGLVRTSLVRGVGGTGMLLSSCLLPGQTGMQDATIELGTHEISEITSLTWEDGAINLTDAVASTDLRVSGMTVSLDSFGGQHITGTWENHARVTIGFPSVRLFGLNAVGRPLFTGNDIDSASVPANGTWTFLAYPSFLGDYASLVAFPDGND